MTIKHLLIKNIIVDPELQLRFNLSEDRVKDFVDIYHLLPEWLIVRTPDGKHYLADGWHRRAAALQKKETKAKCEVVDGDYKYAFELAIEANSGGPLPLTREEKRKAVEKVIIFFPERADSWIAEMLGVSMQLVQKNRAILEEKKVIKTLDSLDTRDGRQYPKKIVENIKKNVEKSDSEREGLPSREDTVAEFFKESQQPPPLRKSPSRVVDDRDLPSQEKTFIDNPERNGEDIVYSFSLDGKSAVKFSKRKAIYNVTFYSLRGGRFFPVNNIMISEESYEEIKNAFGKIDSLDS